MTKYTCHVCGYPDLTGPPRDPVTGRGHFDICPCCGCEFGYEDATPKGEENYRKKWIETGAKWFHPESKPKNWDLKKQLKNINK